MRLQVGVVVEAYAAGYPGDRRYSRMEMRTIAAGDIELEENEALLRVFVRVEDRVMPVAVVPFSVDDQWTRLPPERRPEPKAVLGEN